MISAGSEQINAMGVTANRTMDREICRFLCIFTIGIRNRWSKNVASPGIEPGSGASETLILSIVRRGLFDQSGYIAAEYFNGNGQQYYAKKFTYSNHSSRP